MQNLNTILNDLKKDNFNPATHGAVLAIIKNTEGKYLIIQRSSTDEDGASLWDFAGGSCDTDDVQSDCEREVFEETGLKNIELEFHKHLKYVCPWKDEDKISFVFVAEEVNSDDIKLSEEHDSYVWVTYEEMLNYEFYKKNLPQLVFEMFVATQSDLAYWKNLIQIKGKFNGYDIFSDNEELEMGKNKIIAICGYAHNRCLSLVGYTTDDLAYTNEITFFLNHEGGIEDELHSEDFLDGNNFHNKEYIQEKTKGMTTITALCNDSFYQIKLDKLSNFHIATEAQVFNGNVLLIKVTK